MTIRLVSWRRGAFWLAALLVALTLVSGCQRVSRQETAAPPVQIELIAPLFAPASGPAMLHVELRDEAGHPIEDARVSVRGDMTHAGMIPVLGQAVRVRDGVYDIPFEWTMGGDWVLTVDAELADGRLATDRFNVGVVADGDRYRCTVTRASTRGN